MKCNVKSALADVIKEISYRRLLFELSGESSDFWDDLEEKAIFMAKVSKYDALKILNSILKDDFIDDTLKLKFVRLAAAVSE